MNQHSFARLQTGLGEQSIVSCDEDFRNSGGIGPIQIIRNPSEVICGHYHKVRLCSGGTNSKYPITYLPRIDFRTSLRDLSGELHSRDVGRGAGRWWILALPLQDVGAI